MRVLVYTDPGTVHSIRYIKKLSQVTAAALFWCGERRDLTPVGVPCYPLLFKVPPSNRRLKRLAQDFAILSTIKVFRPDLIHVHREPWWCKKFKQWVPQVPVIFTTWGHISNKRLQENWGEQIALADGFTGDAQTLLDELLKIPGCEDKPSHIFRFGISEEVFRPAPPSQMLKHDLNLPPESKLVYSARSLRNGYNHETLVKAMPLVLDKLPNTFFVFVNNHGHRYPDAIEYRDRLIAEIQRLGLSSHARFLDHAEDHSRVAMLFQTSDVAVSIPVEDGFPATIIEAMACGTPLVISDLPDYTGVVDASNAIRIAPTDSVALAQAILTILSDDTIRKNLRQKGLETISAKGNLEKEVVQLLGFFHKFVPRL
jgi:glycosyltransferase involved in cell wall biosynthesis